MCLLDLNQQDKVINRIQIIAYKHVVVLQKSKCLILFEFVRLKTIAILNLRSFNHFRTTDTSVFVCTVSNVTYPWVLKSA